MTIVTSDGYKASLTHLGTLRVRKGGRRRRRAIRSPTPARPVRPSTTSRTSISASGSATPRRTSTHSNLLPPRGAPNPPPAPAAPPAPSSSAAPAPPPAAEQPAPPPAAPEPSPPATGSEPSVPSTVAGAPDRRGRRCGTRIERGPRRGHVRHPPDEVATRGRRCWARCRVSWVPVGRRPGCRPSR